MYRAMGGVPFFYFSIGELRERVELPPCCHPPFSSAAPWVVLATIVVRMLKSASIWILNSGHTIILYRTRGTVVS